MVRPIRTGAGVPKWPDFDLPHPPNGNGPAFSANGLMQDGRIARRAQGFRFYWMLRNEK
jgi:hypothetical protein